MACPDFGPGKAIPEGHGLPGIRSGPYENPLLCFCVEDGLLAESGPECASPQDNNS